MGWKGVIRSAAAASRAANRESQRRHRAIQRGHQKIDNVLDRFEGEIERDLERIRKIEARISSKPISASGIRYDEHERKWSLKEISDETGSLRWSLGVNFSSDAVISNVSVTNGGRIYDLISTAVTRWGVFIAFRVTAASTARPNKLFNKSDPTSNRVSLKSNGVLYRALEGQLDMELPVPGSDVGVVAFPLPKGECSDVTIEFFLKDGTSRMQLSVDNPHVFSEALSGKSLVDQAKELFAAQAAPLKMQADEIRAELNKKTAGGSGLVWVVGVVIVVLMILVAKS